ncbi:hypothetical protein B0H16DRAFT_1451927 [Mycena metata]|uniref:DUF6534 domain-containing protein n=1 Tax=Mycena metata TaxID=1033252 RepID=A0AAD7NPN0_9AGAR|nr:hypothetical protein B0H16DRAFT_1451927 [Mycena metata]
MSSQAIPTTVQNLVVLDLSASYGALIIAAYIGYPDDRWTLKALLKTGDVCRLFLLPQRKLPDFHVHSELNFTVREALHEAWVGAIIVIVVQLYFLRRIAMFASTTTYARSWWLRLILAVLIILSVSQVPYCAFSINRADIFIPLNLRLKRAGLVAACVVDVFIAVTMIMLLRDAGSIEGRSFKTKRTSRTIRRLIALCVNTGLVTAVIAILSLILDEAASGTVFWTAIPQYPQCSVYLSAFLANLNARHYLRGDEGVTISNVEDIHFANSTTGAPSVANVGDSHIVLTQMGSGGTGTTVQNITQDDVSTGEKYGKNIVREESEFRRSSSIHD